MNDQNTPHDLPVLSDDTIARIERSVFAEIGAERTPVPATTTAVAPRGRTRRRRWLTGLGIAAAFVVGVLVTPPILGTVGGGGSATTTADYSSTAESAAGGSAPEAVPGAIDRGTSVAQDGSALDSLPTDTTGLTVVGAEGAADGRDIIATAQATVQVDDIAKAAATISALAEENDGYVESTEVGRSTVTDDTSAPAPADSGYGWISIRVPSADLPAVIAALGDTGDVLSSSTSKQDVTATTIDLQARIDATQASVTRLTDLMAQSGNVSELIEAEVALTDRQAQLESYQQQLASIDDQVAMSSLQVQLTRTDRATADPAGFGDGLFAGWNGLVVSLNALVIAVGFLLPWLGVAAVVVLIVWLIRRATRARRARATAAALPESAE